MHHRTSRLPPFLSGINVKFQLTAQQASKRNAFTFLRSCPFCLTQPMVEVVNSPSAQTDITATCELTAVSIPSARGCGSPSDRTAVSPGPNTESLVARDKKSMHTIRTTFTFFTCFGSLFVANILLSSVRGDEISPTDPVVSPFAAPGDDIIDEIFGESTTTTATKGEASPDSKSEPNTTVGKTETDVSNIAPEDVKPENSASTSTVNKSTPSESAGPATSGPTTSGPGTSSSGTRESNGVVGAETKPETSKTEQPDPLTPAMTRLREKVRDCLSYYYHQQENVVDHSPWGVMHVLIAYGVDTQIYASGKQTNAISYLCYNGQCRGQQLFYLNRGKLETRVGPGVQGHDGQYLAMMAQSRVKIDYPMHVDGKDFTIQDLVNYEMRTCEPGTELTFKLIGLSHYLDTDTKWKSQHGEDWSLSRLIREELAQPVIGAACGGTHRLMGFNYAVRKREKEGKPMTGQWTRARKFLDDYFEYTFYLQNQDGSFSTDFFRGPNAYGDINQRIETTGHILEWFVASLSDKQLRDERVVKSVEYLTTLMMQNRRNEWEIGPKGHALHALAIYSERVFGDRPGMRDEVLARAKKPQIDGQKKR